MKNRTSRSVITTYSLVSYDFVSFSFIVCNDRNSIVSMRRIERSMDTRMEYQILSFKMKDSNQKDKSDSHQSRERRKYSSSGFYDNYTDGQIYRSTKRTHRGTKKEMTITPFPVSKVILSSP
jgi:hypothetical protein